MLSPQKAVGLAMFFTTILPTNYLIKLTMGGMYSPFFKQYSPAYFVALSLAISLMAAYIIASIFISKTKLFNRLPPQAPGSNILAICGVVILLPSALRVFTSTIEGGGASFALINFSAPFVLVAKLIMYVGLFRLLMAVHPNEVTETPVRPSNKLSFSNLPTEAQSLTSNLPIIAAIIVLIGIAIYLAFMVFSSSSSIPIAFGVVLVAIPILISLGLLFMVAKTFRSQNENQ